MFRFKFYVVFCRVLLVVLMVLELNWRLVMMVFLYYLESRFCWGLVVG